MVFASNLTSTLYRIDIKAYYCKLYQIYIDHLRIFKKIDGANTNTTLSINRLNYSSKITHNKILITYYR